MEPSSDYANEPILGPFGRSVAMTTLGLGLIAFNVIDILEPGSGIWSDLLSVMVVGLGIGFIWKGVQHFRQWRRKAIRPAPRAW